MSALVIHVHHDTVYERTDPSSITHNKTYPRAADLELGGTLRLLDLDGARVLPAGLLEKVPDVGDLLGLHLFSNIAEHKQ